MAGIKNSLFITGLFITILFLSCSTTTTRHYNFSLKNTLSIFLLNDGKDYYFTIPIQYIGDYQIESFEFNSGYILIGDYRIMLSRDDLSIDVFVNESSDEYGNTDGVHTFIHSEKNGSILVSKMDEPLTKNHEYDNMLNQYNILVEYILKNNDMDSIFIEYEKGNIYSMFYLEYTITLDNERMSGCGYLDNFELYNGPVQDASYLQYDWFPPNLDFLLFFRPLIKSHP
jgi:hypothetical protein